jgi:hypothetical protein
MKRFILPLVLISCASAFGFVLAGCFGSSGGDDSNSLEDSELTVGGSSPIAEFLPDDYGGWNWYMRDVELEDGTIGTFQIGVNADSSVSETYVGYVGASWIVDGTTVGAWANDRAVGNDGISGASYQPNTDSVRLMGVSLDEASGDGSSITLDGRLYFP